MRIPQYYQNKIWSKQTLIDSHSGSKSPALISHYAENLDRIYNIFKSGRLPDKSFIVIGQRGMGKLTWAYSCMSAALKSGYSVMPIIDNTQFKRLNILSSDRMYSPYLKEIPFSIEQYLAADVVFISIDPDNFQTSFRTIESLLSKRARLGHPTFILSRYTLDQLSLADFSRTFKDSVSRPEQDWNKYLVVIGGLV